MRSIQCPWATPRTLAAGCLQKAPADGSMVVRFPLQPTAKECGRGCGLQKRKWRTLCTALATAVNTAVTTAVTTAVRQFFCAVLVLPLNPAGQWISGPVTDGAAARAGSGVSLGRHRSRLLPMPARHRVRDHARRHWVSSGQAWVRGRAPAACVRLTRAVLRLPLDSLAIWPTRPRFC